MKWKGKKVSNAHYFHLRRSVEYRLVLSRSSYRMFTDRLGAGPKKYIGGKMNGTHIRRGMYLG